MIRPWLYLLSIILFSSCSSYKYHVAKVSPVNLSSDLTFENEDLILTYDFWDLGGSLDFDIYNKTDEPIYIDWEHSNFIFNDYSYNYYTNETSITSFGNYSGYTQGDTGSYRYTSSSVVNSTVEQIQKNDQIPPNSSLKSRLVCLDFPDIDSKNLKNARFDKSNSLLTIRTYIGYTSASNLNKTEKLQFIDNEFYVESIADIKKHELLAHESRDKFYLETRIHAPHPSVWVVIGVLTGLRLLSILRG